MNYFFIKPRIQPESLRCFSSMIENFKKTYKLSACYRVIPRSLPITDDKVSSTKEINDLCRPLLEVTKLILEGRLPLPALLRGIRYIAILL